MKIHIGSYEAKTKLPELLRQVKAGKSFTITNRGKAIADLVPSVRARSRQGGARPGAAAQGGGPALARTLAKNKPWAEAAEDAPSGT